MSDTHFDVLIVGGGLSGVGAGARLAEKCPGRSFAILEGRDRIGGTWDLFRYPGVRSDSDMYTLGFPFRPWSDRKSIAGGDAILRYIKETAREFGVDKSIRFNHWVKRASWSTSRGQWALDVAVKEGDGTEKTRQYSCNFLYMCSGYYSYKGGYFPDFPGMKDFAGQIIHPQQWPADLDYTGKRVVVIGSGATAVTLVPAMAEKAAHVTMLQRSPTYMIALPDWDPISELLRLCLPSRLASSINRMKNAWLTTAFFQVSRRWPNTVRKLLRLHVKQQVGKVCDVDVHFNPRYNPWDQRLCVVANGDLFKAMRAGKASVATDHIERFTEKGIKLRSGEVLETDIIVSATGLQMVPLGEAEFVVDGKPLNIADTMTYKGMMFEGVPNMAQAVGYTNASWTLKCDLTNNYVCRLLNHMDEKGYDYCVPRNQDPSVEKIPFIDFSSGYIQRALDKLPKQGSKAPWRLYQNYARDILALKYGALEDEAMRFEYVEPEARQPVASSA